MADNKLEVFSFIIDKQNRISIKNTLNDLNNLLDITHKNKGFLFVNDGDIISSIWEVKDANIVGIQTNIKILFNNKKYIFYLEDGNLEIYGSQDNPIKKFSIEIPDESLLTFDYFKKKNM